MLNFLLNAPDLLPDTVVYNPALKPPGLDAGKAIFFRCELNANGSFVLRPIDIKDVHNYRCYYYSDRAAPALALNIAEVVSGDYDTIEKSLIYKTKKMVEASDALSDKHPVKVFCNTILNMSNTAIISLVKSIIKEASSQIANNTKKGKEIPSVDMVKIIFEIYQPSGSGRLIHQSESYRKWSDALGKFSGFSTKKQDKKKTQITDIFGNTGELNTQSWRGCRVQGSSEVVAFQKNKDSECYSAYGFNSTHTQPVTDVSFAQINTGLSKLFIPNLRGKTWASVGENCLMVIVPVGAEDNTNVLIESPSVLDICGETKFVEKTPDQDSPVILSLNEYIRLAEQVIKNLRGTAKKTPNATFQMLIIKKIGKGSWLTVFNDSINIAKMTEDTQKWSDANAAVVEHNKFFKYVTVYDAVKLLNRQWSHRAGLDSSDTLIKSYGDTIECNKFSYLDMLSLFRDDDVKVSQRAIDHFGRYHVNLLVDVALRRSANESTVLFGVRNDYFKLNTLASVLFSKKGMTMENVKEQPAYLVGVCVGIIDRLHKQFYDDERGGKYPRKFLGGSTVPMFLAGNSLVAWNHLTRSTHWLTSWAKLKAIKTPKTSDIEWGTKEDYHWLQKNISKLSNLGIPNNFTPEDRALFGLGFGSV